MKQTFSRIEPKVADVGGMKDVVISLTIGLSVTDEKSGLSANRDAVVPLPDPDPDGFTPFEQLGEDWAMEIAEREAKARGWAEECKAEILTRLAKPKAKAFAWANG